MDAVLRVERDLGSLRPAMATRFYKEHPLAEPNPYAGARPVEIKPAFLCCDRRAELRQKATTILEPAIAYEPPAERRKRPHGALQFREHVVIGSLLVQMRHDLQQLWVNRLQYAYGKLIKPANGRGARGTGSCLSNAALRKNCTMSTQPRRSKGYG
jgi:hypothetical protein